MFFLLSIVGVALVGFVLFHRASKKSLDRQLGGAISAVQAATYERLLRRYEGVVGRDVAINLAVAVTNELFGNAPTAEIAIAFRKNKSELIAHSLRELKSDHDLRVAVTDANRVLVGLKGNNSSGQRKDAEIQRSFEHLQKLIELGVLLPDRPAPQHLSSFLAMAHKYHEQNESKREP